MSAVQPLTRLESDVAELAEVFVTWLETGVRPAGLFTDDVFCDLTVPQWRVQAKGFDAVYRLREGDHPFPGDVHVEALDRTSCGFLLQFSERWEADGQRWYCREMIHCVVTDERISELAVSCTGDWDADTQRRHADQVRLLRP
jgi:hypothetical protein